jgi:HAD superfamily hydrolase (TIGR01509 family)
MPFQALIFNVDGTLADTERDGHRLAFNAAFADAALDWYWDVTLYGKLLTVTGGKERMRFYAKRLDPGFFAWPGDEDIIDQVYAIKTQHYLAMLKAGQIPLRPGVAELLREARQVGLRLAIATTTALENVTTLLTANLGPDAVDWFDVIGAGDIVPNKKPAPDIYLWVLERLGLPPEHCLAIEDSANGLQAALAAHLPTLVTTNAYTASESFTGALAVLPDLSATTLADIKLIHEINKS